MFCNESEVAANESLAQSAQIRLHLSVSKDVGLRSVNLYSFCTRQYTVKRNTIKIYLDKKNYTEMYYVVVIFDKQIKEGA